MDEAQWICGCGEAQMEALTGAWHKRTLTYKIAGSLPGLDDATFAETARAALDNWSEVCPLTFRPATPDERPDFLITTGSIDGSGKVLAWCELPPGDDRQLTMKIDAGDHFTHASVTPRGLIGLEEVMTHEFGHGLGLVHDAGNTGSLMDPIYVPGLRKPQPRDVARIQKLYPGEPAGRSKPTVPQPKPAETPTASVVKVRVTPMQGEVIEIVIPGARKIEIPGYKVTKVA